jgi:carboxypeptidase PM20D1
VAHLDVVPVEAGTDTAWTHPPFGGAVADGYVWGRGTLDDKASATALLEAVRGLLARGARPRRTVILALGHDEEVGGRDGAQALARLLARRGVEPAFVLDEGGAVTVGAVPGLRRPVALVGIAEKGYLSVELRAEAPGGHSSMPGERLAIDVLSRAVRRLTDAPLPARLTGVTGTTFDFLAPEMPLGPRAAFANRWLLAPALRYALAQRPVTDAAIRTTTAPTVFEAGAKDNVIPSTARAVVNFRLLPGDTVADVLAHVRATLDGLGVRVRRLQHSEATPVAPTDGAAFAELHRAIQAATPEPVVVAPYLVPGATDARHYARLTPRVYRFVPFRLGPADRSRIHGRDERLPLADYAALVAFYQRLMAPPG